MTTNDIRKRLKEIRKLAKSGDFEAAYSLEISLYEDVLKEIASGNAEHVESLLAREALKSARIKFFRVTA